MRAAIYARVSTLDQHCEMQLKELREYCERRGWTISGEYVDTGWSGAKASRPELDRIMHDAGQHRFDAILVWKLDRFGRSVLNLSEQLARLNSWGIRFLATTQALDTDASNPTSRLMLHILASVAEFERDMIRERVTSGLKNYREAFKQKRVGRDRHSHSGMNLTVGRPRKVFDRERAFELRQEGLSMRAIARKLKVSIGTVHGLVSAPKKAPKRRSKTLLCPPAFLY
jgi:putative DNA-invertase from lambdoid prophage Rac